MTFHVAVQEYRYRYKLDDQRNPVACILPKRPSIKRFKEDFETQTGAKAFADLVLRQQFDKVIPTWPRRAIFLNPLGDEVSL